MVAEQDGQVHDDPATSPPEDHEPTTERPAAPETADVRLAYEIVYECRDKMLGARLAQRLEDVVGPTWDLKRVEEGPSWALVIEFPSRERADRFFDSEFYRQFCIEARRSCRSSVLVVPLGAVSES